MTATLTLKATAKDEQTGIAKIEIFVDGHHVDEAQGSVLVRLDCRPAPPRARTS